MRESPRAFTARTGRVVAAADVSIASQVLGTTARPLADDEPCPTLFRDVGPQALALHFAGRLQRLEGEGSQCIFFRDATLPGFTGIVEEIGVLVFLQPCELAPWFSGQPGIYVAENGRMPTAFGFVPRVTNVAEIERRIGDAADAAALRDALGGSAYDEAVAAAKHDLQQYLETWQHVESESRPWRALVHGPKEAVRQAALHALANEGVSERDLSAPLFQLSRTRRTELAQKLSALAAARAALGPSR